MSGMRLGLLMIVLCFGWTAQAMAALQRPTPQFSVDQGERITVRSQNGKTFFELQERQWFDKEGKPLFFGKLSNPMEMEDKVQIDLDGGGTSSHVIVDLCESDLNYIRRVEEAASRVQGGGKREADRSSVAGRFHSRAGRMEKWWEIERKMKEFPVSELHNERAAPFKFVQEHKTGVKDWTPKELPEVQIPFVEDEIDEFFLESRITISQDGRLAAVGMGDTTAGKVKIFDLKTEKLLFELETFNGPRPLSFSSDNQMLAIGYENPMSPVQIWKLSSDGFEYLYGFRLFVQGGTNYGTFLDNETLAFTGFANVNVVDLANGRVLASAPAKDCNTNGGPAYLLAEERETPFVLDMQAGTAKRLDTEMVAFDSNMSITADGRLAAFNDHFQRRVWVHDLKSDKRLVEIRLVQNFPRPTQFLTNRYLLVGKDLLDLKHSAHVGTLPEPFKDDFLGHPSGAIAYVRSIGSNGNYELIITNILTPERLQEFEDYVSGPKYEMPPGSTVTFEFSGVPTEHEQDLREEFSKLGLQIGPGSDWVYRVTRSTLPQETITLRLDQERRFVRVSYQPTKLERQLVYQGDVFWENAGTYRPTSTVVGKPGETPKMAVDRICNPGSHALLDVPFPIGINYFKPYPPPVIDIPMNE